MAQNPPPFLEENVENIQTRLISQIQKLYESIDLGNLMINDIQDDVSVILDNNEIIARVVCKYCKIGKPLTSRKKNGKFSYIDVINFKNHLIRDHKGNVSRNNDISMSSNKPSLSQNDDNSMSSSNTRNLRSQQSRRFDNQPTLSTPRSLQSK